MENTDQATSELTTAELPHKPHHFLTQKVAILIIIFLLVSLASLIGAAYVLKIENDSKNPPPPVSQNKNSQKTPTPTSKPVSKNPLYTSVYNWQINYPPSLKIRESPAQELQSNVLEQVNFSVVGKTQTEGTEFFDGMSLGVAVAQKQPNESLQSFADRISKQDAEVATRDYFREITVNGSKGYTAQINGLGTYVHIFLPRGDDTNTALWITYMSVGPDKTTYDQMIKEMLETFTVKSTEEKACTMEAKLCPDGSSVGRQGPTCEFAACPGE